MAQARALQSATEIAQVGAHYHYWPDQATIDANRPMILHVQRAVGAEMHGRAVGFEPSGGEDVIVGDPFEWGSLPQGIPPADVVATPTIGAATLPPPLAASVASHSTQSLAMTAGTWYTLTGGTLSAGSNGLSWDAGSGELAVMVPGTYAVTFDVAQNRAIGLSTPTVTAAVWAAGVQTDISARHALGVLGDDAAVGGTGVLVLDAADAIQLRERASANTTVDVSDFTMTARRL